MKDPKIARYSVYSLRVGDDYPTILPALEVDLSSGQLYFHGVAAGGIERLIKSLVEFFGPSGSAVPTKREMPAPTLDVSHRAIFEDPDFNPRVYLSARGQLELCARSPEEATKLASVVAHLVREEEFRSYSPVKLERWEISMATPHHVVFEFDSVKFDRVVVKIGLAVIGARIRRDECAPWRGELHEIVLGNVEVPEKLVVPLDIPGGVSGYRDAVTVVAPSARATPLVYVGVRDEWFAIGLPADSDPPPLVRPIGAICRVPDRGGQRWLTGDEAAQLSFDLSTLLDAPGSR